MVYTIKDNVLVLAGTEAQLKAAIDVNKDGESVTETDGIKDAAQEVGDNSVMALVVSGAGLTNALRRQRRRMKTSPSSRRVLLTN